MKKGTLVLLSDFDGENSIRQYMLDGAMKGGLGVAAASLPRHISLGMPYVVKDYDAYLKAAEEYAAKLQPITVKLTGMTSKEMGPTGGYFFTFDTDADIDGIRKQTREFLRDNLQLDVPEQDSMTGTKTITLGFGKAPYSAYMAFVESVPEESYMGCTITFDKLGVFYYDEDKIAADNFFCCRQFSLNN